MFGIFGAMRLRDDAPLDPGAVLRMHRALSDGDDTPQALYRDENAFLGLVRVPATRASAIAWSPEKQHAAAIDGAIYSHPPADIPSLFAASRSSFVHELLGEYAIAIYSPARQSLQLVRDRLGVRPLYVTETTDHLIFASEIAAIAASGLAPGALHPTPLAPGHQLEVFDGKVTARRYWSAETAAWDGDIDDASELVRDAVMIRARADKALAAALSGGRASTLITTLARANLARAYTVAVSTPDETARATATCKRMALRHTVLTPDEPVLDALARQVRADGHTLVIGGGTVVDDVWRRNGLEMRLPLLDHRVVEAVTSLAAAGSQSPGEVLRAIAEVLVPGFG